jgi:peroxiredoxin
MATTDDAERSDDVASPRADDRDASEASAVSAAPSRLWWSVGIGFLALVGLVAVFSRGADDVGPTTLEQFTFQTPDGGTATLADFEGPLVVNYFAAWCGPCRAELPDFEAVHRELGSDVTIIGISRDTVTDAWRNLVADTGVTFPTVFEGTAEGSFVFLDGRAMPTTVFITAEGEVAEIWGGPLDDDRLRELIAEHLT